jgi:hypothetical protein
MTLTQRERYARHDSLKTDFLVKHDAEIREAIFETLTKEQFAKDVQGKPYSFLDLIK